MAIKTSVAVDRVFVVNNIVQQSVRLVSKDITSPGDMYFEGNIELQSNTVDKEFSMLPSMGYICLISDRPFILKLGDSTSTPINVTSMIVLTSNITKFYISNPDPLNTVNITVIVNSS
ncbi:MAG: hypothetical protein QXD03_02250 [Candidatus Anstonellales archaeon]